MFHRWSLLLAIAFLFFLRPGSAQEVLQVDSAALDQHVAHRAAPIYPPIAKAALVQGTVVFDLRIGASGKIESLKVVSGPPMLQQAAIDCLKQWSYRPFDKDGAPFPAAGRVSIEFSLGKDGPTPDEEKLAQRYFPTADECRKGVNSRSDFEKAAAVCEHAAELAEQFAPDRRFIEKRSAFVWAAWAFVYSGDLKSAVGWAEKAVEVVKLGHDDNSGSNAAYGIRAIAEGKAGNLTAADRDFSVAEDFGRKGIVWAKEVGFEHSDSYKRSLVQDLQFHAQILQGMNRPDEAQKKLDEAAGIH